jgi:nucleoside-diphosphate kinase
MQRTLIILKPDAVKRKLVGRIIQRIEDKGFLIEAMKMTTLTNKLCEEHYAHLKDKPFFPEILNFMTSSPVLVATISGSDVIKGMRILVGKTNWLEAEPGTIRGDFAFSTNENLIHASDSEDSAEEEIKRFFS